MTEVTFKRHLRVIYLCFTLKSTMRKYANTFLLLARVRVNVFNEF